MTLSKATAIRVRELLQERSMTQYRLEQLTCISHSTMNCFLNERNKSCNLTTVFLIINALNLKPKEFFDSPVFEREDLEID